jgi:hypothetical protein
MDRSLICIISGNKYTFTADYFDKKVKEYGDIDSLRKYFATKKVKSFIQRGYSAQEIRNILSISSENNIDIDSLEIKEIINYHLSAINKNATTNRKSTTNFSMYKSDQDVISFINNIKSYE